MKWPLRLKTSFYGLNETLFEYPIYFFTSARSMRDKRVRCFSFYDLETPKTLIELILVFMTSRNANRPYQHSIWNNFLFFCIYTTIIWTTSFNTHLNQCHNYFHTRELCRDTSLHNIQPQNYKKFLQIRHSFLTAWLLIYDWRNNTDTLFLHF